MRRTVTALAILALLAVPTAANADPSTPTPPERANGGPAALALGLSPEDQAAMARQDTLSAAAEALNAAVSQRSGFTGIELAEAGLVLRWKGTPPAAVRAAISQAGVPVRVVSARYARAELERAAGQLRAQVEAGRGNGVHSIGVKTDGSGLRLGLAPEGPIVAALARSATLTPSMAQQAAVAETISAAGVTIPTTVAVTAPPLAMSRENDFAPWAGGIVVVNKTTGSLFNGERCTGGFGVRSSTEGRSYLVTASHCGALNDSFTDGAGESIGKLTYRHPDHGVALVRASSVSGEIYVGGPPGQAQSIRGVARWTAPFKNQMLCQSGAASGNVCGLRVESTNEIACMGEPGDAFKCWGPLVLVIRDDGGIAGRLGDSGSPLYYLSGARAVIVGAVIGGDGGSEMYFVGANIIDHAFDGVGPYDSKNLELEPATRSY